MIGECFYYDTPPNGRHLFVVLAPIPGRKGWFLCANITTKREDCENPDTTCELYQGEHQELTEPVSIVVYGQVREMPLPLIQRETQNQGLPQFGGDLLLRIQRSPLTEFSRLQKGYKKIIQQHLGEGQEEGG